MRAVFPLVQKYGGFVVALTLDENGIPETPEGRLKIAERIISRAREYGIRKKDIIVDALTMAVSAGGENAAVTLATLRLIKATLGVHTVLGVSNVSFGLPHRERLNAAFFTMAMHAGLDAAIINPHSAHMRDACYSAEAILGRDFQCARYIEYCRENEEAAVQPEAQPEDMTLYEAVRRGLKKEAGEGAKRALAHDEPIAIIDAQLVPALNEVGQGFEKGTVFLPQLLMSADAAKAAFDVIKGRLGAGKGTFKGTVVVATVQGDVHDIGKNIVKALLENYRFKVIDLGKDVPPEAVLEAAGKSGTKLVGLSALMTTTVDSMRKTIALLKKELPGCRIMVGGAVLTKDYAKRIGADFYATDAMASVHYAQEVYSK